MLLFTTNMKTGIPSIWNAKRKIKFCNLPYKTAATQFCWATRTDSTKPSRWSHSCLPRACRDPSSFSQHCRGCRIATPKIGVAGMIFRDCMTNPCPNIEAAKQNTEKLDWDCNMVFSTMMRHYTKKNILKYPYN